MKKIVKKNDETLDVLKNENKELKMKLQQIELKYINSSKKLEELEDSNLKPQEKSSKYIESKLEQSKRT